MDLIRLSLSAADRDYLVARLGQPGHEEGAHVPATPDHHDAHQLFPDNPRDPTQLRQLEPDLHYISVQEHLVGAEGDVRVGEATSGRDVVFEPVPGAGHDLTLVHPLELPVVLAPGDQGAQGRLALAQRTRLMWTDVGEAVELAADVEDTDLTPPYLHDPVSTDREIREVAQDVLLALTTHRTPRRLPPASMLKSRRAFSPKILRLTSFVKGIWCTFEGRSRYLTGTPVVIMCTRFAIMEKVWLQMCRPNSVSNPCVLKGKTGWMTVTLCMSTGRSAAWAASKIGSYCLCPHSRSNPAQGRNTPTMPLSPEYFSISVAASTGSCGQARMQPSRPFSGEHHSLRSQAL